MSRRRTFLAGAALALPAFLSARLRAESPARKRRVAVIGHTGRGNYGHGLDTVWRDMPDCEVVAVADADEAGLAAAVKRLNAPKGYRDYRKMLDEAKPELLSICPRWVDQHRDMVLAAVESGVRGFYMEKPPCRTPAEADEMIAACAKRKVKAAISFQTRYSPKLPVVQAMIRSGALGQVLEYRARGKEDSRGGGEDLWVLGVHMFNLLHFFGGPPQWCFASVEQAGRPICKADVKEGGEGLGPLCGDKVHAMYRLESGATACFDSTRNGGSRPPRFGLHIFGSAGVLQFCEAGSLPAVYFLPDPTWTPGRTQKAWIPVSSAGLGKPEPLQDEKLPGGNRLAVRDLIEAVDNDRQPLASLADGRVVVEMVMAAFESQRLGTRVPFPLTNRENPLNLLS